MNTQASEQPLAFGHNYRKGTWTFEHQKETEQIIEMFLVGKTIAYVKNLIDIPQTTAQGLKARVTKWQREHQGKVSERTAEMHEGLLLWA